MTDAAEGFTRWLHPQRAVIAGVALSATVFGLAHFAQPAEVPVFLLTWVLSGIVLGIIYVLSGNLALTIGVHASFNIAYQALFVRGDVAGMEGHSAVARVGVDPKLPLLAGFGGLIEATAFIAVGVLAALWLWHSRGGFSIALLVARKSEVP